VKPVVVQIAQFCRDLSQPILDHVHQPDAIQKRTSWNWSPERQSALNFTSSGLLRHNAIRL
jgi:hypothetical protein